ncbi:MAG: iron-sulfur cluster assembly scaffold protein [Microgenomates group bacterium]
MMDHFLHPRNMGELPGANGVATVGNKICGDVMKMYLKIGVKDGLEIIEDAKFQTLGCGAAIATSSIATEMIRGKPLAEAEKLTNKAVMEALGGLPPAKIHCSVLAEEAVKKAIENYRERQK